MDASLKTRLLVVFLAVALLAGGLATGAAAWRLWALSGHPPAADADGGVRQVTLTLTLTGVGGFLAVLVASALLATHLAARIRALSGAQTELARLNAQLQDWNESYLRTLAFITHEIKNQTAATRLNLLALRDGYVGTLSDEQREAIADVLLTVNRTDEMLLNYLNLSRIEKSELVARTRPVALRGEVIEPVLSRLGARLADRQMRVELTVPVDLTVQADPSLLQTVYENLITNAAKYGQTGGLIRLSGGHAAEMAELHVWNEGQGVAPENLGRLFGKFSRLRPPGEQAEGTGLGLFIDREIIRLHGGEIRAESAYGEWIDFVFTLPRPDRVLERPAADTSEPTQPTPPDGDHSGASGLPGYLE